MRLNVDRLISDQDHIYNILEPSRVQKEERAEYLAQLAEKERVGLAKETYSRSIRRLQVGAGAGVFIGAGAVALFDSYPSAVAAGAVVGGFSGSYAGLFGGADIKDVVRFSTSAFRRARSSSNNS